MIWFRRALVVPLILVLILVILVAVIVTQTNDTVANPRFYNDRMLQADVYNFIYDELLPEALVQAVADEDLPIDVLDIKDELIATARDTLPPDWLQYQFESSVNELIPYMVGDTDHFSHTFIFRDRVEAAGDSIVDNVLHTDAFTTIYDDGMAYVAEALHGSLQSALPPNVSISQEETESVLRTAASEGWVILQTELAVDSFTSYMAGQSSHFNISLPLQEVFTDEVLLDLLGEGNEAYLDEARDWISEGWSYTDSDLMADLNDGWDTFQDIRGYTQSGYTVTETDLRDAITDDEDEIQSFDDVRGWIHTGRTWLWGLWVVLILIVVGIGFLGGRGWKSRSAWALGSLLIATLIVFITVTLLYANVGEPRIEELKFDPWTYDGVERVMAEKGNELIQDSFDTYTSGANNKLIYIMIASSVGLLGVASWYVVNRRPKHAKK